LEFGAICVLPLRRVSLRSDFDDIEKREVVNFDEFQKLYVVKLKMFKESVNCNSVFHAFSVGHRIGNLQMIWGKVIEIKHKKFNMRYYNNC
jgi:hypothetical protein